MSTTMTGDDRLERVVPFILERIDALKQETGSQGIDRPLILGLNGIQGCGKSTLVERLQSELSKPPHSLGLAVFSIDDLYLPHEDQVSLAKAHPKNPLVQHRGQPSTHDVELCANILDSLRRRQKTAIPVYDKSAFNGQGDRSKVKSVSIDPAAQHLDLVILEGWFMGFRTVETVDIEKKWSNARKRISEDASSYNGRLGYIELESVLFVNEQLKRYDKITDRFDALVHVDAEDIHFVYDWRLEAEHAMIKKTGSGMSDEEVKAFVDGYYPSYELYTEALRSGAFGSEKGKQLRLVVDRDRKVTGAFRI